MLVLGKEFHSSLIFECKAGAYLSEALSNVPFFLIVIMLSGIRLSGVAPDPDAYLSSLTRKLFLPILKVAHQTKTF
jgi:hypothetical protein